MVDIVYEEAASIVVPSAARQKTTHRDFFHVRITEPSGAGGSHLSREIYTKRAAQHLAEELAREGVTVDLVGIEVVYLAV